MLKKIAHISIAVTNLDRACAFYHDVMGGEITDRHRVDDQKVEVAFVNFSAGTKIELIAPTREDSPVGRFLAKHGPGIHHICFETDNIEKQMAFLSDHGVKLIDAAPRRGAEHDKIAFVHPSSALGTLIELSEPLKK
ncbi:MAG TPA: methylmalonyl-CoA epimerase [bacterium]|nr:methylmalonyl-CoA epimerase [bacterium]